VRVKLTIEICFEGEYINPVKLSREINEKLSVDLATFFKDIPVKRIKSIKWEVE